MRHVKKDLEDIPPSLISVEAIEDIEKISKKEANVKIKDSIYKGEYKDAENKSQSQVRDYLNKYYKDKCAYCEDTCKAEIEHYRPKKGVADDKNHSGYYWLCYTWTNLVPSCRYCNTEGGKGNKFPIMEESKRVYKPNFKSKKLNKSKCDAQSSPLIDEKPYLLHPEIDDKPEDYFAFQIKDDRRGISIKGIDAEKRGAKTIEICNLNRNVLCLNRLTDVYENMRSKIYLMFGLNASGAISDDKLIESLTIVYREIEMESNDENRTFTLLRKFLIKNVDNFKNHFAPYIEIDQAREIAVEAFARFKS